MGPLHGKNLEKLDSPGLPIFSVVSLKEKEITANGTFKVQFYNIGSYRANK